jgi:hypothetical protein
LRSFNAPAGGLRLPKESNRKLERIHSALSFVRGYTPTVSIRKANITEIIHKEHN